MMKSIYGKQPTAKEATREGRRNLTRATRDVEREITSLKKEEKKLIGEIKRTAKMGNEVGTRMLARQLVRLRQQITKLEKNRVQIRGVSTHMQVMHANTSMATSVQCAANAMGAINKQMAPEKQKKVMQDFQRQSERMDMMSEMMKDTIDDALDDGETVEEADELTDEILDSIGVDLSAQLASVPKGKVKAKDEESGSFDLSDLDNSLETLRGR